MPTHTSAMNAASGSTMPADHSSAGTMLRRLASANVSSSARMTARLAASRAAMAAGDDEEAERDRAVRRHRLMSPGCAGRSMAMNSRGVAR